LKVGPAFAQTVRHFFPQLNDWLDQFPDPRCQERVTYKRRALVWCGLLMFVGKLGSRRQFDFQFRDPGSRVLENLNRLAVTEQKAVPCHDTLDDYLALIG
jgi:hypothetical protein